MAVRVALALQPVAARALSPRGALLPAVRGVAQPLDNLTRITRAANPVSRAATALLADQTARRVARWATPVPAPSALVALAALPALAARQTPAAPASRW